MLVGLVKMEGMEFPLGGCRPFCSDKQAIDQNGILGESLGEE
jgi:hypothetical protein